MFRRNQRKYGKTQRTLNHSRKRDRSEERRVGKECRRQWLKAEDGIRDRDVTGVQTCALPILDGREVIVMGWVSSVRDHGNLVFIMLNDKEGEIQITVKSGVCSDEIRENMVKLKEHSTIAVKGTDRKSVV